MHGINGQPLISILYEAARSFVIYGCELRGGSTGLCSSRVRVRNNSIVMRNVGKEYKE